MKITNPDPDLLQEATAGDLAALDRLLRLLQPGVYNLALRMLGQRDDAADATQEMALSCTQGMLMALDRPHRLAYVLDLLFDLDSQQAGEVLAITAAAYRQRLSRARARVEGFAQRTCGRINADAVCRCEKQLPAIVHARQHGLAPPPGISATCVIEHDEAERAFDALVQLGDAAALFRAHPAYQAPQALLGAIRAVLQSARLGPPGEA